MAQRKVAKKIVPAWGAHWGRLNNGWTWATTVVSAVSTSFIRWFLDLSGLLLIGLVGLTIVVVLLSIALTPTKRWAAGIIALYAVAVFGGTMIAYNQAQSFSVTFGGIQTAGDPVSPEEGLKATRIQIVLINENDFPLTARSHRRYVAIANQVSGDEGEDSSIPIPAHSGVKITDLPITFIKPLSIGQPIPATIDFAVCFARDKEGKDFRRQFRFKGTFELVTTDDGRFTAYAPRPAEPKAENDGMYDGCTR